jgi:hypothetical protein
MNALYLLYSAYPLLLGWKRRGGSGSNWILAAGVWNDSGVWEDSATWNDS